MAGLFKNDNTQQEVSQRELLEAKYKGSTHNLLVVTLLTLINIILLVTQADRYFLFSAYVPYALVLLGMLSFDNTFLIVSIVLAASILLLYLLSWIFSKKNKVGWMIFALVFFTIDTVLMLLDTIDYSAMILDIVLHAWVIISLTTGIINYFKLKKLPVEVVEEAVEEIEAPVVEEPVETVE